ncbi:MAG TPA: chemotaxis protein CheX [Bryobacteraceae bacterium]|nr:chemotaxis protein CheX [Bryobacteraceae bacterium]
MTTTDLYNALSDSAEEVLETMFFATVVGEASPAEAIHPASVAARLVFHGQPSGVFTVAACPGAARSLAAAFLALEENEVPQERAGEVVCELANMICGSVLSRLEPEELFELKHPEPVVIAGAWPCISALSARRALDLGDGTLNICIEIET